VVPKMSRVFANYQPSKLPQLHCKFQLIIISGSVTNLSIKCNQSLVGSGVIDAELGSEDHGLIPLDVRTNTRTRLNVGESQ
jgi:hypothetical protein